jgi:hypothetical protein
MSINWNSADTPENVQIALRTLAEEYPLSESTSGKPSLIFKPLIAEKRTCHVSLQGDSIVIEHSDLASALRGVSSALAGLDHVAEETSFTSFGIMLDCSRNAVMKVDHLKKWLRKLALLGYNQAMLYTEDTYQLPGEPYFGYQRGAYSVSELREIDLYAASLGIEMVPCIQTLGHLAQILKWAAYADVKDTSSVLLVDEEKTYALIEKMIKNFADNFKTRRIHVGMDETHDLGRGRFMDLFGYERGFDIFNRHLARVTEICKKYGLKPMIWSDMFFRMGSKNMDYYDKNCIIPDDVKKHIPAAAQLVYWDYYHIDEEFYLDWIGRHRALGFEPIMGSGVWTWAHLWYGRDFTEKKAGPCIKACRNANVKEIFFTMWGDDGAYCEFDSAMAGLAWTAELSYAGQVNVEKLSKRFSAVCHADYNEVLIPSDICNELGGGFGTEILWDDPLLGIFWHNAKLLAPDVWTRAADRYRQMREKLENVKTKNTDAGDLQYALALIRYLERKIQLGLKLESVYPSRDKAGLKNILDEIPQILEVAEAFDAAFRTQWLRRNKSVGLEVIQIRLAGTRRRFLELAQRIGELLEGKITKIDELEDRPQVSLPGVSIMYQHLATACENV